MIAYTLSKGSRNFFEEVWTKYVKVILYFLKYRCNTMKCIIIIRKEMNCNMAQLSIRVPDEMKEELEVIAKEERRSVAFIVKEAIQQYLEKIKVKQED